MGKVGLKRFLPGDFVGNPITASRRMAFEKLREKGEREKCEKR